MAKKPDGRTFNVSVIGLSGTEKEKGSYGVGKSCLCNRFIHTEADDYHLEHISVLSQSDFGGRVINNDHFLYWGDVTKTDEGSNFTFHVIEQTEFIDDVSFTPFKTGRTDPYTKRCVQTKVQSAEKLMYICKDQLGMETDSAYEQKLMPDGKLNIDGILCCFDVSNVTDRSLEKQVEFCVLLLNNAMKTKKPVVLVTTKNDSVDGEYTREVEKMLTRKEFSKHSIPIVETSAHENVNVESAFLLLAHMMMDKSKARTKVIPYNEASKAKKELMGVAKEAFKNLMRNKITDSKLKWPTARKKLEKEPDYQHYVDLFGTDDARNLVRQHLRQLRDELVKQKLNLFLKRLPDVLCHFLPDLETIGDRRSWTSCQNQMAREDDFDQFFVKVCEDGESWTNTDFVDNMQENRLPFDMLTSKEAETCFRNHVNALQAARKKEEMKKEFWTILDKNVDKPGGLLSEYQTIFYGKDCYTALQELEQQHVFEEYQRQLKNKLRIEFQELLWERPSVFRNLNLNQNLTEDDLNVIYNSLNDDQRFKKFHKLEDDRKVMLLNHVVFLDKPSVDRCFFHTSMSEDCSCTECVVSNILRNERRIVPNGRSHNTPDLISSGPIVRPLNLVLLGIDGLAKDLLKEIRSMCMDDEYKVAHRVYSLDYRPLDGDVSEEGNSFIGPNFRPQGCICVYNSPESLEYIRSSLVKTLEANNSNRDQALHDLPLVIMLAYQPYTKTELDYLQRDGKLLATSLQCTFVDIPEEDLAEKLKFYPEQIEQGLNYIIKVPGQSIEGRIMEDTTPDLRILLCMMCSDPFPMEIPLQPFLNEPTFLMTPESETSPLSPEEDNMFTVDMNLGSTKQKVGITVTSYHGAHRLVQNGYMYHGYILVYCPKRRASLASLKAFAETVNPAYMLFLAVPEDGGSRYNVNEHSHGLKDGKDLAKKHSVYFLQVSRTFRIQTASQVYNKFLRDVWDHRDEVEYEYEPGGPPAYDQNYQRPPAPLPNSVFPNNTSSNSQSTEDSEPVYDQPTVYQHHSDGERSYTPSPPPLPRSSPPPPIEQPVYRNDNELVKPSMLKEKRDQFAGQVRDQYRKSFPIGDCQLMKIRSGMSQSMTENLDSEAGALPRYQFRKSRSMKLAVKDEVEAWAINDPHRHPKTSPRYSSQGLRPHDPLYDSVEQQQTQPKHHDDDEDVVWSKNAMYDSSSFIQKPNAKNKYALPQQPRQGSSRANRVQAPLAMPEKIEISETYGTVKDALYMPDSAGHYALVDDALPEGKIHRITSTSRKHDKGTDSEESETNSYEPDKNKDLYMKVNRKPTPHKKKHKQRNQEGPYITQINIDHHPPEGRRQSDQDRVHSMELARGRSNSPSEDSAGTGDETQLISRPKRRSVKKMSTSGSATHLSDGDIQASLHGMGLNDDEESVNLSVETAMHKVGSEDNELDPNSSGRFGTWMKKKTVGKDSVRTQEKRRQDEERRKQRENEKKQREQQKLQKKMKKKDSKASGQSESGLSLNDFPMSPNNPSVPHFIEKCIEFIESEGLHAEGIYRIPGNKAQVDILTAKYSEDFNVDISMLDIQVNAVATVLKAIFADLSDPLVPITLYDELIEASERTKDCLDPGVVDKSSRIIALRGVFLKMHPLNFEVLKFLITHLHKVSNNYDQNSMDSKNLSRCWWPTLFRMEFDTFEKMTKYSRIPEEILQTLIEQCSFFFHSGNEI